MKKIPNGLFYKENLTMETGEGGTRRKICIIFMKDGTWKNKICVLVIKNPQITVELYKFLVFNQTIILGLFLHHFFIYFHSFIFIEVLGLSNRFINVKHDCPLYILGFFGFYNWRIFLCFKQTPDWIDFIYFKCLLMERVKLFYSRKQHKGWKSNIENNK